MTLCRSLGMSKWLQYLEQPSRCSTFNFDPKEVGRSGPSEWGPLGCKETNIQVTLKRILKG